MTVDELIERALIVVGLGEYQLGAGGWRPNDPDNPFHPHYKTGKVGADCSSYAIRWLLKLDGHRPGFGRGPGAHVTDDINSDSALFDALYNHDLFDHVTGAPRRGDHIIIPSVFGRDGRRLGVGHVMLCTGNRAREWDDGFLPRPWDDVDIVHCHGPNGRRPGVEEDTASFCAKHDAKWLRVPKMWTQVVRVKEDVLVRL